MQEPTRSCHIGAGFRQEDITADSILEMNLLAGRGLPMMSQQPAAGDRGPHFHKETGHALMRTSYGADRNRDARERKRKNFEPL